MSDLHPTPSPMEVTRLLHAVGEGDSKASAELLPLVYEALRKLAQARMAEEPNAGHGLTLQPTALVHEAYIRLVGGTEGDGGWDHRGHFFAAAAIAMRRILVDRARARLSLKRGGDRDRVQFDEVMEAQAEAAPEQILGLDRSLEKLSGISRRASDVVMLRCFAGLTIEETARSLSVSEGTVKDDWRFARAWLRSELEDEAEEGVAL